MNSACESGESAACASTSAQCATRVFVVMSSNTVGESAASDGVMSWCDGSPSGDTPPGHAITIGAAGENPSAVFHAVGSALILSMFVGSVPFGIASRLPVAVDASSTSNAELGHGTMQCPVDSGLQFAGTGKLESLPPHAASPSTKTKRATLIGTDPTPASRAETTTALRRPSRYNLAVRQAIVLLVLLGCGTSASQPPAKHVTPPTPVAHGNTPNPHPTPNGNGNGNGNGSAAPPVAVAVPDIGCPSPTCAFHAGAGAYFTCLAGGAGACFHFGAPCAPSDACMYDPNEHSYKACQKSIEGTCAKWGTPCTPASKCMFDPQDGLHHTCDDASPGSCKKYGALCAP